MKDYVVLTVVSFILGSMFFKNMDDSIPEGTNCSYSANMLTDIIAFIAGGYVANIGYTTNNKILYIIGVAIIVEHIWQLNSKRSIV